MMLANSPPNDIGIPDGDLIKTGTTLARQTPSALARWWGSLGTPVDKIAIFSATLSSIVIVFGLANLFYKRKELVRTFGRRR